jgi:hypothetical protein
MRVRPLALAASAVVISGCAVEPTRVAADRGVASPPGSATSKSATTIESSRYLPVGTRVPVGQPLRLPIEPYNPVTHGPPSMLAAPPRPSRKIVSAPSARRGRGAPEHGPGATVWAEMGKGLTFFHPSQQVRVFGLYGIIDVQLDVSLPPAPPGGSDPFLFSPTNTTPGSCVEMGVLHWRGPSGQANRHDAFVKDWCDPQSLGNLVWLYNLSGSFYNDYVRSYLGEPTLSFSIVTPNLPPAQFGACWYAHFYNFTIGGWVQLIASCKRPTLYKTAQDAAMGWSSWIAFRYATTPDCPATPSIRAMELQVLFSSDNQYHPFFPTVPPLPGGQHAQGYCWAETSGWVFNYPFSTGGPGTSWRVDSPFPY